MFYQETELVLTCHEWSINFSLLWDTHKTSSDQVYDVTKTRIMQNLSATELMSASMINVIVLTVP